MQSNLIYPQFASCLVLAIDRPRKLPATVFVLQVVTFTAQAALFFGVPDFYVWPYNISWLAEVSRTCLLLGIMLVMPMRDPRLDALGSGANDIASPYEAPSNKRRSPEDNITLWQWMSVSWMGIMITLGQQRQLHDEDVWHLPYQFQHERLYQLFHDVQGTVTRRVLSVNAPDLVITSVLGILDSLLSMLPIVLLKDLLASLEGPEPDVHVAAVYAIFICITNLLRSQCGVFSLWYSRRCYERRAAK